jgi:hypothetical protein
VLEGLSIVADRRNRFAPNTPSRLRAARTCYDHIAGTLGVSIHHRLRATGWLLVDNGSHDLTLPGTKGFEALGIDVEGARLLRRPFAYACLDWSERRPHLGGALGAALRTLLLKRKWVVQDPDSRVLSTTGPGRRELLAHIGLQT